MRTTCTISWWRTKGARCSSSRLQARPRAILGLADPADRRWVAGREGFLQRFVQEILDVLPAAALGLLGHVRRAVREGRFHRPACKARSAKGSINKLRGDAAAADRGRNLCVRD